MAVLAGTVAYGDRLSDGIRISGRGGFDLFKRIADIALSLALLIVALPLVLACIVIIKVSSRGPAIIRQTRLGKDGRLFGMFKLRTMRVDAEVESGPVLAAKDDDRILPLCRWMRKSHVDELPQLINVILGDMSLVGPRPERPEIAQQIHQRIPEFRCRLQVRPGITGLAQVRNGYDTCLDAVEHKLQYDLDYIRRRSWLMELGILALTLTKLYDSGAR